jgi:predicted metal-dependent hydrolase
LSLCVSPEGKVEMRAPFAASEMDIDAMMRRHQDWLFDRQAEAAARPIPEPLCYRHGTRLPFLGNELALTVQQRPGRAQLRHQGQELLVSSAKTDREALRNLLSSWYTRQARRVFSDRLEYWSERLDWVEETPALRLRRMRARWGSCSRDGRICLNTRLIKADRGCIDAVIVHELCHLLEFNHSRAFYRLMDKALPDWRSHQRRLDHLGPGLLRD